MFFEAAKLLTKKQTLLKEPPPFVDTGWRPPSAFPNLSAATVISYDTETKETDFDHGPGWARGKGHIVGFSIAAVDRLGNRGKWYFPVRHELEPHYNIDPKQAFGWLKEQLETPIPKVGQNLLYDNGWLTTENIHVEGQLHDTSFAEALIDEQGDTNLDHLARKYLGIGKTTEALYTWLADCYGGKPGGHQRANIYRCSPRLVGPYAEDDADQPLRILDRQWPIMVAEGTLDLFHLECSGIPMFVRMRNDGMAIDINLVEQLYHEFGKDIQDAYAKLRSLTGLNIDSVTASAQIAPALEAAGIKVPKTEAGAYSIRKEWLKEQLHPVADCINDIRGLEKLKGTFLQSYLLEGSIPEGPGRARVHCQFHPLRSEDNGAKTGRLSSSDPNLQNIPSRSKQGKRIRKAFTHEKGHLCIQKGDYSQIEYRMLAHFASSVSSDWLQYQRETAACEALRAAYNNNPKTDYHENTYAMVAPLMGWEYPDPDAERKDRRRKPIKNVNFGLIYGQSEHALAYKAGFTKQQAKEFFAAYHEGAPYARATMAATAKEVQDKGYITTILGRRCRFNLWEPKKRDKNAIPMPLDRAIDNYGMEIKRAGDYRGTNYKLQGSGTGDIVKASMIRAFREGVFNVIGFPKLQVHDELVFSVIDDSPQQREAYAYLKHVMENTTPCRVPIIFDVGRGPSWGEII